jgi:hypothetical protein
MKAVAAAVIAGGVLFATMVTAWAQAPTTTEKAPPAKTDTPPGKGEASATKVHGTIDAVDKQKGTVTLKGPKGRRSRWP